MIKKFLVCALALFIIFAAVKPVKADDAPSVLFIGTLSYVRGLDQGDDENPDAIRMALNSMAEVSNVTYYLFNNDSQDSTADYIGTLNKGETIEENFTYSYNCHRSLNGFLTTIRNELNGKAYDYIVLEFDSARLAVGYGSEVTITESMAASALLSYYSQGRVLWVTDNKSLYEPGYDYGSYAPGNRYDEGSTSLGYLTSGEYKALLALLSPAQYTDWEELFGFYRSDTLYELESVPAENKAIYTDSAALADFLKARVQVPIEVETIPETEELIDPETVEQEIAVEAVQVPDSTAAETEAEMLMISTVAGITEDGTVIEDALIYGQTIPETTAAEKKVAARSESPDTGDTNHPVLYLFIALISLLLIALNIRLFVRSTRY